MDTTLVIGVDPGPTTGIVAFTCGLVDASLFDAPAADIRPRLVNPMFVQCDAGSTVHIIASILAVSDRFKRLVAVERFVVGTRSARSGNADAGRITRDLIGSLSALPQDRVPTVQRSAAEIKPWATDHRLSRAGLFAPTKGMNHARDAARHALFAAVRDCGLPDPARHVVTGSATS